MIDLIVPFEKPVSLNKFYASRTHYFRSGQKKIWREKFGAYIKENYPELVGKQYERLTVVLEVNHNRMDIDNQIMTAKFLVDTLEKDLEVIKSDGPKNYREITMRRNESLELLTGVITVTLWNPS